MNILKICGGFLGRFGWLALAAGLVGPTGAAAAVEETFDVLQIGARTYTNVTVTTKAKNYVFLMHASGLTNFKVADLPADLRAKLGYNDNGRAETSAAGKWVPHNLSKIGLPQIKQLGQTWRARALGVVPNITINSTLIYTALGIGLLIYGFFSYCSMLICQKTGTSPGLLVWVPVLQLIPLLRAAGMSGSWFLAYWVPGLNIVAQVVWSVQIAKTRGKTGWVALLLLLPLVNLLAFLYLAFSEEAPAKEERPIEIMTLETA